MANEVRRGSQRVRSEYVSFADVGSERNRVVAQSLFGGFRDVACHALASPLVVGAMRPTELAKCTASADAGVVARFARDAVRSIVRLLVRDVSPEARSIPVRWNIIQSLIAATKTGPQGPTGSARQRVVVLCVPVPAHRAKRKDVAEAA